MLNVAVGYISTPYCILVRPSTLHSLLQRLGIADMRNIEALAKAEGVGAGSAGETETEAAEDDDAAGDLVMTQIQRCEVNINSTQVGGRVLHV